MYVSCADLLIHLLWGLDGRSTLQWKCILMCSRLVLYVAPLPLHAKVLLGCTMSWTSSAQTQLRQAGRIEREARKTPDLPSGYSQTPCHAAMIQRPTRSYLCFPRTPAPRLTFLLKSSLHSRCRYLSPTATASAKTNVFSSARYVARSGSRQL